jgi:hypothetical protein
MLGLLLPTSLGASSASIADSLNDEIAKLRKQIAKQQATISKQQVTIETLEGNNKSRSLKGHVATVAPPSQAGDLSKPKPPETPPWWGTFLLRKDNLEASDILFPGTLQQNDDAKGANFNWTSNYIQKTNNITTQTYLGWLPPNLFNTSPNYYNPGAPINILNYTISPFTYLNGSLTNPYNAKTEKSAAQFGLNGELAVLTPLPISLATFSVLPYYQTDFRGYASIAGFQALVEPYDPQLHLGSQVTTGYPQIFDWYWRLIGEANPIWVDNAGLTSFESHTTYGLVGGMLQLRGTLFANMPSVPQALCGRISVLGWFEPMWDLSDYRTTTTIRGHNYVSDVHGGYLNNLHAEVDYDLIGKKSTVNEHCDGSSPNSQDQSKTPKSFLASQSFDASLSLTYDTGVDFSTYQRSNKFMLGLTLLY